MNIKSNSFLAILLFLLVACNSSDKKEKIENTDKDTSSQVTKKETKIKKSSIPEYEDKPIKCNLAKFKLDEFVLNGKKIDVTQFKYVFAKYQGYLQYLTFANYEIKKYEPFIRNADDESMPENGLRVDIRFSYNASVGDGSDNRLPNEGTYEALGTAFKFVYFYVFTKNNQFTTTPDKQNGMAKIMQVSKQGICGTLDFRDKLKDITLKGEFNLPNEFMPYRTPERQKIVDSINKAQGKYVE